MGITFQNVTHSPLQDFSAGAPDGVVIGVIGATGAGQTQLLRLAAGLDKPSSGFVEAPARGKYLGLTEPLSLAPASVLALDHTFAQADLVTRERAALEIEHLRRSGTTILLASHEEELLRRLADEIWWLEGGRLAGRGGPEEMLTAYRQRVADCVRAWGSSVRPRIDPRLRRGDGRAEVLGLEMIGEDGKPTMVWRSGELAVVKVPVRFREAVADPVIGMLIRTRIGLTVYGTNTELEKLKLGPCAAGETLEISFAFRCELCPGEYTLTVASHDPDGSWHDWLEDAVAFGVTDSRYTAGVANLRATVRFVRK